MEVQRVALVLVDISGYTRFITNHIATVIHAETIIGELLEAVIDKSEYPLTLSKLEGDGAFLYAPLGADPRAETQEIVRQISKFFDAFRKRERELIACITCRCDACQSIDRLKLKAFLHSGETVIKKVKEIEELGGTDAILLHRLAKNTIPSHEYIAMTDPFYELSGGLAGSLPESRTEMCEGIGGVPIKVYYLTDEPAARLERMATPEELRAMENAFMDRADTNIVNFARRRGPRRHFNHLKMEFTPRALFDFMLGALAHAGDIIKIMRGGPSAESKPPSEHL
jgi:uncharacterized protein DUF2652